MRNTLRGELSAVYNDCVNGKLSLVKAQEIIRFLILNTEDRDSLLTCFEIISHISLIGFTPNSKLEFLNPLRESILLSSKKKIK